MKVELRAVLPSTGLPGVLDQGESEVDGRVLLDLDWVDLLGDQLVSFGGLLQLGRELLDGLLVLS